MRKSGIRTFCIILAFLILGTACTAAITKGFTDWNPYGWFDKIKEPEKPDTPDEPGEKTEAVTDGEGNAMVSGKVYNLSSRMLFAATTAENAETADGITVQATIEPSDADNKAVDWSVSFVNSESTWAKGKTVTDYVTVTPESDGSLTATVKCLKAFGEQINITVTSRDNSDATASCTADYYARIADIKLEGMKQGKNLVEYLKITDDGISTSIGVSLAWGVGTIIKNIPEDGVPTYSAKFYSGANVMERIRSETSGIGEYAFIAGNQGYELPVIMFRDPNVPVPEITWTFSYDNFLARTFTSEVVNAENYSELKTTIRRAVIVISGIEMSLEVTATYDGQTVTKTFMIPVSFNVNIGVTGINLDNTSLKF